jgi:phage/plasmid-like protein (TIGR03299 family)
MSQETVHWLNTMTLIGFTEQRGHAWHYRADEQAAEPNHYPAAIPVQDVRRRLFDWKVLEGDVRSTATVLGEDGVGTVTVTDRDRKAMLRPPGALGAEDPGAILGVFKSGYAGHDYERWLLEQVAEILDDELAIGSAGLLKGGALAWVSIEVPETITTPEGVAFRPHLLATTSFDGSVATTYGRKVQLVVCDNTHAVAMGERGQQIKVRHSRHSHVRLTDAREALALVHTIADDFAAEVAQLSAVRVSDGDWARFLDELAPLPDQEGRSRTLAQTKREGLQRLWDHDTRVAPWRGTAFGVMQAVNTFAHHEGKVRGMARSERNMLRAVTGEVDALDRRSAAAILQIAA